MRFLILAAASLFALANGSQSGYISDSADPVGALVDQIKTMGNVYNVSKSAVCWKDTKTRGVGRPIHACANGMQQDAGLCYKPCSDTYYGVGPVCWQYCEPGFTDEGALCGKAGSIISANNSACPWYDVCGLLLAAGCSTCPEGYHNDGCTCRIDPIAYAKKSYGRGVGVPMGCASDEDYDAGLCYPKCPSGYAGVGPVCWETCPAARPAEDAALCCTSAADCNEYVEKVAKATIQTIAAAVEAGEDPTKSVDAIKQALELALDFVLPLCIQFD